METPLYSKILEFSESNPLRLHIPGHKGKIIPLPSDFLEIDVTELSATGNLYEGGEPFDHAQSFWANQFGLEGAQFLTGGSTQGVYTALGLCAKEGGKVLLDRGAHRSAFHAMGLLRLEPVYLKRPWLEEFQVPNALDPHTVEEMLVQHPDITTVFLTSPTYCGIISDVPEIARITHEHGAKLVVDGAHGAHLSWLMMDNYASADVVTLSAHKTLPTLGQGAVLLYSGFSPEEVRETASLFGSSSPSYPILCSMDIARAWMEEEGMMEYLRVAREVATLREILPSLTPPLMLDPLRLTVLCPDGKKVAKELEKEGIYLEMANPGHIVAVFTGMDTDKEVRRFGKAMIPFFQHQEPMPDLSPPEMFPVKQFEIHQAMFAKKKTLPLSQSVGEIAASTIAPYPPGVPVVVMGEVISQEILDYLQRVGYENDKVLVVDQ